MDAQDRFTHVIVVALAAALAGAVIALVVQQRDTSDSFEIGFSQATPTAAGPIEAYITGAVAQPGVYEIADGDRVVDLLYQAGGPAPEANLEALNLAIRLRDEDQVVVPRLGEAAPAAAGVTSQVAGASAQPIVNINTASAAELDALPGIGEVYSQRIVDSRANDGPFATADELVERRIIPRGTYEKIRDLISAGP